MTQDPSRGSYRQPARRRCAAPELPPRGVAARSAATLASLAGLAGAGALVIGHVELLALAGAGAAAAAVSAVRAAAARRRTSAAMRFLDTDAVLEGPGTWTVPDGTRRLRAVAGDPLVRFERLDPASGETRSSFRAPSPIAPPAIEAEAIACRVAVAYGRAREDRCFLGAPPEVQGAGSAAPVEARSLVLVVRRDGALLERRDAHGALVGDTLHADERAALAQVEAEYGDRVGPFRAASSAAPVITARAWDEPIESRLAL